MVATPAVYADANDVSAALQECFGRIRRVPSLGGKAITNAYRIRQFQPSLIWSSLVDSVLPSWHYPGVDGFEARHHGQSRTQAYGPREGSSAARDVRRHQCAQPVSFLGTRIGRRARR